jgi:hypothetical protein
MEPSARIKRHWDPPAITIEMPFRQTHALNGCAADNAAQAPNTFTPVVKVGGAADSLIAGCSGTS